MSTSKDIAVLETIKPEPPLFLLVPCGLNLNYFLRIKTDASSLGISLEATIVITAGQTFLAIFLTGDWFILSILTY